MKPLRTKALWLVATLLAANAVLLAAAPGYALPRSLGTYFFGPKLVRAEVVLRDGGSFRDFLVDRGRVRNVKPVTSTIVLQELDGTVVSLVVSPTAEVTVNGRPAPLSALRKGWTVTTVREGDQPAVVVQALRRGKR